MNHPGETLTFSAIAQADIETFEKQKEKIVTAVTDHLFRCTALSDALSDPEHARIARECVKIFTENFLTTVKYQLPEALLDYVAWLRGFLASRSFPPSFIPHLIAGMRNAVHAFLEEGRSDDICAALRTLRLGELQRISEVRA